jgi:hypothetical protein
MRGGCSARGNFKVILSAVKVEKWAERSRFERSVKADPALAGPPEGLRLESRATIP